jgi:hypothetical protein
MPNKSKFDKFTDWCPLLRHPGVLANRLEQGLRPPHDLMEELCIFALRHNYTKSLALLMENGAKPTPILFMEATYYHEGDALCHLLAAGGNINSTEPATGNTALHYAAIDADWTAMLWLAGKGARWSNKNLQGDVAFDLFRPTVQQCSRGDFARYSAHAQRLAMDEEVSFAVAKAPLRL